MPFLCYWKGQLWWFFTRSMIQWYLVPFHGQFAVIDGGYADWFESECNAKCGGGTLTRSRNCTNPPPSICGKACIGPAKETITCNEEECSRKSKFCPVKDYLFFCILISCKFWLQKVKPFTLFFSTHGAGVDVQTYSSEFQVVSFPSQ